MIKYKRHLDTLSTIGAIGILTQTLFMISLVIPSILGTHSGSFFVTCMVLIGAGCHMFIIHRGYLPTIIVDAARGTDATNIGDTKRVSNTPKFKTEIEVILPSLAIMSGIIMMFGNFIAILILLNITIAVYGVYRAKCLIKKFETLSRIENAYIQ